MWRRISRVTTSWAQWTMTAAAAALRSHRVPETALSTGSAARIPSASATIPVQISSTDEVGRIEVGARSVRRGTAASVSVPHGPVGLVVASPDVRSVLTSRYKEVKGRPALRSSLWTAP